MTNPGTSVISNAALTVTPPQGDVTLLKAAMAPRDKSTGFGAPAASWTQPVNLDVGQSRIYTFKVRVDRCAQAGNLVFATAVGAVTGPTVTVRTGVGVGFEGCIVRVWVDWRICVCMYVCLWLTGGAAVYRHQYIPQLKVAAPKKATGGC